MLRSNKNYTALSIAGSDSCSGAGIQADLETFSSLNVFGVSAISCITAQNPDEITEIMPVKSSVIFAQIKMVCDFFSVGAVKIGMLYSSQVIQTVSDAIDKYNLPKLVVDPVMKASSGVDILHEDALDVLCSVLLPKAFIITPNIPEAEILCGHDINSIDDVKCATEEIAEKFNSACVIKGGHSDGCQSSDILFYKGEITVFSFSRFAGVESHGSGCRFSAALTAYLAMGKSLVESVKMAKCFMNDYFVR